MSEGLAYSPSYSATASDKTQTRVVHVIRQALLTVGHYYQHKHTTSATAQSRGFAYVGPFSWNVLPYIWNVFPS